MKMHYNEDELQWEGILSVQGQDAKLRVCDDITETEIGEFVNNMQCRIESLWPEIISSITGQFLPRVNERRKFLNNLEINREDYESSLQFLSIFVMEEMACELVFNDQGISGNHSVCVYISGEGIVRSPAIDDWEEERQIRGERVNVSVCNDFNPNEYEDAIREVEAVINELWHDVENVLTKHLLTHYNKKWKHSEDPEIGRDEFLARIELTGVHIMEDKAFDLYFVDNNLFGGHYVELFVESDGSIYEPSLYS